MHETAFYATQILSSCRVLECKRKLSFLQFPLCAPPGSRTWKYSRDVNLSESDFFAGLRGVDRSRLWHFENFEFFVNFGGKSIFHFFSRPLWVNFFDMQFSKLDLKFLVNGKVYGPKLKVGARYMT
jgi:hypothetical protein